MEEGGEAGMLPVGSPRFPLALLHPEPILPSVSSGREHPQTLLAVTSPGCSSLLPVGEESEAPREEPRALPAGSAPGHAPAAPGGSRSCRRGPRSSPGGAPHPARANKIKPWSITAAPQPTRTRGLSRPSGLAPQCGPRCFGTGHSGGAARGRGTRGGTGGRVFCTVRQGTGTARRRGGSTSHAPRGRRVPLAPRLGCLLPLSLCSRCREPSGPRGSGRRVPVPAL